LRHVDPLVEPAEPLRKRFTLSMARILPANELSNHPRHKAKVTAGVMLPFSVPPETGRCHEDAGSLHVVDY
jgi:hypothetical protein